MRKTTLNVKTTNLGQMAASAVASVDKVRTSTDKQKFVPYNMDGGMSATTVVKLPNQTSKSFTTKDNMHSEMCALNFMLENEYWHVLYGMIVNGNGQPIGAGEFSTSEPHCGFCTITLTVLGLPLTKPTSGNHKMACNGTYPIPAKLFNDPQFIVRFIHNGCFEYYMLKRLLNPFVNKKSAEWLLKVNDFLLVSDNAPVVLEFLDKDIFNNIHVYDLGKFMGDPEIVKSIWQFITTALYQSNNACKY
jgi:hypothetical protein